MTCLGLPQMRTAELRRPYWGCVVYVSMSLLLTAMYLAKGGANKYRLSKVTRNIFGLLTVEVSSLLLRPVSECGCYGFGRESVRLLALNKQERSLR